MSRYADVHDAVNNVGVFSSAQGVVPSGFVSDTPVLITMDPPDHTALRKAVQRAFTPKQIAEMEQHIRDVAGQLLDELPANGEADAVTLFTDQLPLLVMTELLGVDLADREMFKRCGDTIVSQRNVDDMAAAQVELTEYLAGVFAKRRAEPRDDFITKLVSPTESGDTLTDADLLGLCFLLLVAGTETTTGGLGTGMLLLDRFRDAVEATARVARADDDGRRRDPALRRADPGPVARRHPRRRAARHHHPGRCRACTCCSRLPIATSGSSPIPTGST